MKGQSFGKYSEICITKNIKRYAYFISRRYNQSVCKRSQKYNNNDGKSS